LDKPVRTARTCCSWLEGWPEKNDNYATCTLYMNKYLHKGHEQYLYYYFSSLHLSLFISWREIYNIYIYISVCVRLIYIVYPEIYVCECILNLPPPRPPPRPPPPWPWAATDMIIISAMYQ
jgi:hypothetical protein